VTWISRRQITTGARSCPRDDLALCSKRIAGPDDDNDIGALSELKKTRVAPDAESIALGRRISEVRARERAADHECGAIEDAVDDAALEAAEAKADAITREICRLSIQCGR
jgi:hypothetical protein